MAIRIRISGSVVKVSRLGRQSPVFILWEGKEYKILAEFYRFENSMKIPLTDYGLSAL